MDIEAIVGLIALAVAIACVISGVYVYYVYRQRNEEALFLTRLVHRDVRVSIASAVIAGVIAWAYLVAPLARPWGGLIIGVALIVLMTGPIDDGLLWRKERRRPKGDTHESAFTNDPRFAALGRRIDAAEMRTSREMDRTDDHQFVQDVKIETLKPSDDDEIAAGPG